MPVGIFTAQKNRGSGDIAPGIPVGRQQMQDVFLKSS
jgi:hypothetical protein